MTVSEPDNAGKTQPIELPIPATAPSHRPEASAAAPESAAQPELDSGESASPIDARSVVEPPLPITTRAASPQEREVLFVPLAVNIGDGFKFGCGFFLALVLVMLVGFVLLSALFVLTGLLGQNLPLTP